MQKKLPVRKKIRLEGYDYSNNGAYFITLCVNVNVGANCVRPRLSEIHNDPCVRPRLSEIHNDPCVQPRLSEIHNDSCIQPQLSEIHNDSCGQPQLSEIHNDSCIQPSKPDIGGVRLILTDIGKIIQNEIDILSNTYDNVIVDKYVIMPDHIHMIILIISNDEYTQNTNGLGQDGRTQFAPTVSQIIKQFKGSITKKIGFSLWQKSFYDRIIRDNHEYQNIWKYIDDNPVKWTNN